MTPNISSTTRIETIKEEEECIEGSDGNVPLGDFLARLNKDGGSLETNQDDDDLSSIGMTSTFEPGRSSLKGGTSSLAGRSLNSKNSKNNASTTNDPVQPQVTIRLSRAKLKKWLQQRKIQVYILFWGFISQMLLGNLHQGVVETAKVLFSPQEVPNASVNGTENEDYALIKFHDEFATPVLSDGANQLQTAFHTMDSFAAMIRKMARHTQQSWPYVYIPEFQQRTEALLKHNRGTGTLIIQQVALAPLVPKGEQQVFEDFQGIHINDHSRYQQQGKVYSEVPRSSRELSTNGGRLEYHSFVPLQQYWSSTSSQSSNDDKQNEWFQLDHVKAALNTIQKTEAPVLLLGRNGDSNDYILQPILEKVLVQNRLFRKNVYETQVVAVLAAQVKFVDAVQQSIQKHFPALGLSTREQEAADVHVSLKDTCNLQVTYKVSYSPNDNDNATQPVQFLGLGTYHEDDWGTASRQVQWNEGQSNQQSSTGSTASGTPFCFPDGIEISLHPTPALHNAIGHRFESKLYLLVTLILKFVLTMAMIAVQGFLCVFAVAVLPAVSMLAWSKVLTLLDEPDIETTVAQAMVKEVNQQLARKETMESVASTDSAKAKPTPQWESMDTSSKSFGSGSKTKSLSSGRSSRRSAGKAKK